MRDIYYNERHTNELSLTEKLMFLLTYVAVPFVAGVAVAAGTYDYLEDVVNKTECLQIAAITFSFTQPLPWIVGIFSYGEYKH